MSNLATKYRPKTWEDVTEQSTVVSMLKSICESPLQGNRNFLLIGPAGCGKAQPLYSKVLTPTGFIHMRDVSVGTVVVTHTGEWAEVSGVYPQGVRPVYEIKLADGRIIHVSDEHLNLVHLHINDREIPTVVTTLELIECMAEGMRFSIPYANINTREQSLRIIQYYDKKDTAWLDEFKECMTFRYGSGNEIVHIEKLHDYECQCIMVNQDDHTYISDNFIPTHNTTLGRIIANTLNKGAGSVIEIDAASHNGVDSVRDIVQQARSYPVGCEYKVFICDECHAFSNSAWQVLLKTLEEGPAKSVFVLATTDPEKIPATIISRVQTFQISKISLHGIENRLKYVIDQENLEGRNITCDPDALNFIAKLANGGMRSALTNLEKALTYGNNITSESLEKALGLPNYDDYFALLSAYAKKDNSAIAEIIDRVYNSGTNFSKWFQAFHSFVMNVVKYIFMQDITATMIPAHYSSKIEKYGPAHSVICLKLANKLVQLNHELKTTQYLQEMALTYLCSIPKTGGAK